MQLISNTDSSNPEDLTKNTAEQFIGNHLKMIRQFLASSDQVLIASPFLYRDFGPLFKDLTLSGLKDLTLVTTCRPWKDDQLVKPYSIRSFVDSLRSCSSIRWPVIHIDQKLHGKVYLFKKNGKYTDGIVTSANLTGKGLDGNHEWGVLINDPEILTRLEAQIIAGVDYVSIREDGLKMLCDTVDIFNRANKQTTKPPEIDIDIGLDNILNHYCTPSEGNHNIVLRKGAQYFIKVSGVTGRPILPIDRRPFDQPHAELSFAKQPKNLRLGDCLLEVAVGEMCFLSYYACASAVRERTDQERRQDADCARWPFYIYANNLSLAYGKIWFDQPLYYDQVISDFKTAFPNIDITPSGKEDFKGAIQLGHSYIRVTDEFGKFVRERLDKAGP